jgi:hypothetical protein
MHNMLKTKLVNFITTISPKPAKLDNVPINVEVDVTTCSQQLKQ